SSASIRSRWCSAGSKPTSRANSVKLARIDRRLKISFAASRGDTCELIVTQVVGAPDGMLDFLLVAPLGRAPVLEPEDGRGIRGRDVFPIGRVDRSVGAAGHEDFHRVVGVADCL